MGVEDRGYRHPPPQGHGYYQSPPSHHQHSSSHHTHYQQRGPPQKQYGRQYVSKRSHPEHTQLLPQSQALTRTQSTPSRHTHYQSKTRHHRAAYQHYAAPPSHAPPPHSQHPSYYPPPSRAHGPPSHAPPYRAPPSHAPQGPSSHAPPPHGYHHGPPPPQHGHSYHVPPSHASSSRTSSHYHGPPSHAPSHHVPSHHAPPGPPSAMSSSKSYSHNISSSRHHVPHPYDYYSSNRLSGQYTPTTPERTSQTSSHDPYAYAPPLSPFSGHHAKSDKSTSPMIHIPSKVPPSLAKITKSPQPKIMEVPSLLSKQKASTKKDDSKKDEPPSAVGGDSLDIGVTKLSDTVLDEDEENILGDMHLPKPLQRHLSQPDEKTMQGLNVDLANLPPTPPFSAKTPNLASPKPATTGATDDIDLTDVSTLGVPTGLTYSKSDPLSSTFHDQSAGAIYGHVNDYYHSQNNRQSYDPQTGQYLQHLPAEDVNNYYANHPVQHNQLQDVYGGSRNEYGYGYKLDNNNLMNQQALAQQYQYQSYHQQELQKVKGGKQGKKKKKKNKGQKKKEQQLLQQQQLQDQYAMNWNIGGMGMGMGAITGSGFDFAVHDLHQQLKLIKKELSDLEKQIEATDDKTKQSEETLKQATREKTKILDGLKMEKMVLQKSLDIYQDKEDDESDADVDKVSSTDIANDKENDTEDTKTEEGTGSNVDEYDDKKIREFWSKQCEQLKAEVEKLRTKNMAASASADITHKHLRSQLERTRKDLMKIKQERELNRNKNMQFELEVIELTEQVNNLKETVDSQRHDNFLKLSKQRERRKKEELAYGRKDIEENKNNDTNDLDGKEQQLNILKVNEEYPPEIVIQQNLIRAQVEFYFSDYNLKRDKRLLEKICKEPQRGYLGVDEVLSLSRVRQLCNSAHHLYDSLKPSPYIHMILPEEEEKRRKRELRKEKLKGQQSIEQGTGSKNTKGTDGGDGEEQEKGESTKKDDDKESNKNDEKEEQYQYHPSYVGRKHFSPPTEKQFPFRRSVYIYGLPWYADEKYIYAMLNAFGGVTKVHFDHGPDTLDRQIMKKMLEKHRVYKLLSKDSAALTMEFNQMHNKQEQYHCYWCHKQKPCADGYYHPKRIPGTAPSYRVCLQCAAAKAEEQSQKYDARSKLLKDDKRLRELLLGLPPRTIQQCKTALCVFASQRQASKCVYVRSRLAYDGAFATHYHHYSKLKKEIALSIKPKIRIIGGNSNNNNDSAEIVSIPSKVPSKIQKTQPSMLKTFTAPVYEQEGTAVIQPHPKKSNNNTNTTTISDEKKQKI